MVDLSSGGLGDERCRGHSHPARLVRPYPTVKMGAVHMFRDRGTMGPWDHGTMGPWDHGTIAEENVLTLPSW